MATRLKASMRELLKQATERSRIADLDWSKDPYGDSHKELAKRVTAGLPDQDVFNGVTRVRKPAESKPALPEPKSIDPNWGSW